MQSKNLKCKALIVSLIYLICLNFGSLGAKVDNSDKFKKLTLKWRLIKNPENESGANKAAFIFINNGPETIKTGKWSLYFNQSFLKPKQPADLANGKIEHLNGDLYRYVPHSNFTLRQGDSLFFEYEADGILFNEKYAPLVG